LSLIYQKYDLQFTQLITFFAQEFFFEHSDYNSTKVILFNLLFSKGSGQGGADQARPPDKQLLSLLYDALTYNLDLHS
jgi:hypothetical protein